MPNSPMHPDEASDRPVRYANGEIQLAVTDLASAGFGAEFTQTRIYSNQLGADRDFGNGYNWLLRDVPRLVQQGSAIVVLRGTRAALWFDLVGSVYVGRYGTKFTLTHGTGVFTLAAPNGEQTVFNDFSSANPGLFKSRTTAGGQMTQVTAYASGTALGIGEVQRSVTVGGVTTIESYSYSYVSSSSSSGSSSSSSASSAAPGADLAGVLLRRQVGGGAWQNIRQVNYAYYGSGDPNGLQGDLQSATIQSWNGSAWQTIDNYYYRYWTTSGNGGLPHGLKYSVGPDAYNRMVAAGLNPLTATNAQVAQYADLYLEYDAQRRVTKETTQGGLYSFTFAFTTNGNPGYFDDYNNWKTKTVETRPDGSSYTVYTNYVGQVMLKQLASGTSSWTEAVQFDANANVLQYAYPSAVAGFNDTQNNLGVSYNANTGLIRKYTYFGASSSGSSSSSASSGVAPPNYVASESVQQGSAGTPVLLKQYQYTVQSAGGSTVYPTIAVTEYRDDAATQPVTTSYAYTFYAGTTAVQQRTTTWPVVTTAQNGSGTADSRVEQFDQWGHLTSLTDERGVVTDFTVDVVTGGVTQRTDDAMGMALVTDFMLDNLGRTIQELGPTHTVDSSGTATTIRTTTWTVYDDVNMQVRSAQGYATGTSPNYTYTLVNPVSITIMDGDNRVTDQIEATRGSTSGGLLPTDTFAQSSYVRWTHSVYNDDGQLTASQFYFSIPASGSGTKGVNYNESDFGFDALGRQNKVISGGGTITRTVHDARGLALSVYVGTNDTGATDSDPTGGGAPGNNMVAVQINQYDGGLSGGDGTLTQQTLPVDGNSANNRVTTFQYDWRNRQVQINFAQDSYQVNTFDTMNRVTQVDRHAQSGGTLIGRSQTLYDNRGRVYQTIRYAVDPSTGNVGNSLIDNTWYDSAGNIIKELPSGSNAFTKHVFDNLGRETTRYFGYDLGSGESSYASASDVTDDTIVEQVETSYDQASNVIQTTTRERFHNATGTGALSYPGGSQPVARVTYVALYPDAIGRGQAVADYGTNGDATFTRSATIPARSDTTLVTSTVYNSRGEAYQSVDPAGTVTQTTFDDAGRRTQFIQNYQGTSSSSSSSSSSGALPSCDDTNNTVNWTYTADDLVATLTAINAETGNQTTTYNYGTTLMASDIARNDLLASVVYPDSPSDSVNYLYNRQSQIKQMTDQRQVVHAYDFDLLGRQTQDRITSLGGSSSSSSSSSSGSGASGVDGTVQRIGRTYEVRGLLQNVTSYSSPIIGQGTVVNDLQRAYNSFEQLITEYQEHGGAVNTSTSVNVQYQYASGSANTVRQTAVVYPNGRVLNLNYGASGGMDDALSRVSSLIDNDGVTHLADYTRLGRDTFVQQNSPQPQIAWSFINGSGTDPYTGLDQFNRVVDNRWYSTATNTDLDRIQHGYDRADNRIWRRNTVAEGAGVNLDELYTTDGLYRLKELQRGQLNSSDNAIVSGTLDFAQAWGLDATGNWGQFWENDTGTNWNLQQTRAANLFNEITSITGGGWAQPAYDAAGNMVSMPQPASPGSSYSATYDAWNRLMSLSSGGSLVAQYAYDGANRRVTAVVSGTTRHFYFTDQWQNLEERLGTSAAPDRQFAWGLRYIDDLVLRDRGTERFYALQDPNWNMTAIVNSSGAVSERYAYAAYGQPIFLAPGFTLLARSNYQWETLYGGYRFDSESSLLNVRRRLLNPILGFWTSRDPIESAEPPRLYVYVDAAPLQNLDPTGEFLCAVIVVGTILVLVCGCSSATPPPKTNCKDPCGDAKKQKLDKGHYGGVVCCDGNKYVCVWRKSPYPFIGDCIKEHEETHLADIDCPATGLKRPGFRNPKDQAKEECEAYKAHLKCLKGRAGDCKKLKGAAKKACQKAYDDEVKRVEGRIKKWC